MTPQNLFDYVVNHLRSQRFACVKSESARYRNEYGMTCAIGCLIPEDEYQDWMEHKDVYGLATAFDFHGIPKPEWMEHQELLAQLQSIHDSYMPRRSDPSLTMENVEMHLERCAQVHQVDYFAQ